MVHNMLTKGKIPKTFWPDIVNWSVHVLNRSHTFSTPDMTSEQAWTGRKLFVDHFKIFECIAYTHVFDQKRKKIK